jgi:dihydroorotase
MLYDLVLAGKVATISGLDELEVGVDNGRIAEVKKQGLSGERTIRVERGIIFPGFVDAHVHLREPGWEYKEDFRTGSLAAAHGGVTFVGDMPNNPKPVTTLEAVESKAALSKKAAVGVALYGGATGWNSAELERMGPRVSGFKAYLSRSTGDMLLPEGKLAEALGAALRAGRPMSLHCESQSVIDRVARQIGGGARPDLHADLRPPEAETTSVDTSLKAALTVPGVKVNVCHASTRGTLELVSEARRKGVLVECESTLHHLLLDRSEMLRNPLLKTNPPLRGAADRASMLQGILDGTVSLLVTDHAPHTREEKLEEGLSGVPGLDDFGHAVSWLIKEHSVPPSVIARVASLNPARYLGLADRGEIAEGMAADFAVVDLDSPETVRPDGLLTKCGWSPYEGRRFPGRVRWTIRDGKTLVDDFTLAT